VLAVIERAATRFWGSLTLGAHATGYVADAGGRPTHLWIAQRSFTKATDPGLYDNLVGGGVAQGQSPVQALVREGWEEAGMSAAQMQRAVPGRVVRLMRPVAEGFQHEWLHSFDLRLETHEAPNNQDGEVAGFELLPVARALALAAADAMTVDASLVTLDFALRHRLFSPADHTELSQKMQPLWL
jgi:8-oxo-dGTP pyrophosphatase MutT (NUDIX family)